jgi:hypothetical protein
MKEISEFPGFIACPDKSSTEVKISVDMSATGKPEECWT